MNSTEVDEQTSTKCSCYSLVQPNCAVFVVQAGHHQVQHQCPCRCSQAGPQMSHWTSLPMYSSLLWNLGTTVQHVTFHC